jgi:preprotein translocase subunit Sec61beta
MAKQSINIGSTANDGTGSTLRDGGDLINDNFNEIYTKLGDGSTLTSAITATATTLTLSNTSFASFQIKDTSEDHTYNFTVNELAANRNVELPLLGSDDVFVFEAHTQTLTNKTLTTPIANAGIQLKNGATSAGFLEFFEDSDNGTNKVTLIGPASTGDVTITLPSTAGTVALTSDVSVTDSSTTTFSNKSIDLDSNTLSGTLAEFNTALQSDSFVSLTGSETLTNKTLTTPTLTTPIANAGIQLKNGATSAGFLEFFEDSDNGTNKVTLIGPASTGDVTLTLPSATDTLVGKDTTDTLTNKTLTNAKRTWITKTNSDSPYTASAGDLIFVDTSGGAVTVTLPASPSVGDEVRFIDSTASFDSNALTVGRNSEKIQGDAADLTVNTERAGLGLAYSGSSNGWLLIEK